MVEAEDDHPTAILSPEGFIFHFSLVILLSAFRDASWYFVDRLPGREMRIIHKNHTSGHEQEVDNAGSQMENENWKRRVETKPLCTGSA